MSSGTKVAGRTVVISGAGSGIGRALARRFSRLGCPLALTDWNADGLQDTLAQLSTPNLSRVLDVRDRDAQLAWAKEVTDWAPKPLAAVINNAGVVVSQNAADSNYEDDKWLIDINFWGVVHGTVAFLPHLIAQRSGTVVNLSSLLGLIAFPTQSAYCASKFAVRGYTESLRHELHGTGVHALTVHPGGINTPITRAGRVHVDALGNTDPELFHRNFTAMARTSPEKAAEVIHKGIERGRARVLVGPDAHLLNMIGTALPVHYFSLVRPAMPIGRRVLNALSGG
ncbi:short-chain alcohol dehydrogenase [Mycolicibacterium phlei]|uniref:SDR family NAD(P)-dependent oxidoreductase n=1 Tax=Mycobacteroides chelonae TaxID=1774 RepID=UPI000618A683|nr:SDR family NAD(P)-dependent oxidoreductase [Mycobacteroides chelonae]VEG20532.1 short-chain alcohol dehydrogenase [Mycolicibacterium phlei]AKC40847.1 acetoin dehydrogenase [Mycobacteroides chelonae]ANB00576.1 acetoin dehydrogenase [Mycobacteroides chelonae CCUG 47445]OLT81715.1 acetoin dehydrogenase [Mycobacteroides chelonae]ORV14466.1 acetoin dehydrogenase [Mycobacteroides chelonae]